VEPFTRAMAQLAAKIDAEARQLGGAIPMAALHFGDAAGTHNLRHFQMVPSLAVTQI